MEHLTPLTPDEALYAFMDGELELPEEQRLFDELAAKPDLRTEMKDILSIRSAIHRDVLFPSSAVESSLLAAAGMTAGGAVAGAASAASSMLWLRPLLTTLGGAVGGGLLVYFLMLGSGSNTDASSLAQQGTAVTGASTSSPTTMQMLVPVRRDTVFVKRYVRVKEEGPSSTPLLSQSAPPQEVVTQESPDAPEVRLTAAPSYALPPSNPSVLARQDMPTNLQRIDQGGADLPQVTLRVRTLPSGLQAGDVVPAGMGTSLLSNAAAGLLFPLGEHQQLGFEMGQETWPQRYEGTLNGRPVQYTQTPALFWLGATYRHTLQEFSFLEGLRPFFEATAGYAWSQGAMGRAQLGLSYQPTSAFAFTLGIDGAALNYSNQGQSFTSTKWGVTYGVVISLGSIK